MSLHSINTSYVCSIPQEAGVASGSGLWPQFFYFKLPTVISPLPAHWPVEAETGSALNLFSGMTDKAQPFPFLLVSFLNVYGYCLLDIFSIICID